jgi:hypothetical protein
MPNGKKVTAPIGVYDEAWRFQRSRAAVLSSEYYSDAYEVVRPHAFTMSGLQKIEHVFAANGLLEESFRSNGTMSDFADELGALVDAHGGTILPPHRFGLIYHNADVRANAAGSWRQWQEFREDRPFAQYRGPLDGHTTQICRDLQDVIMRFDDPALPRLWGPKHHFERHAWETLGAEDVGEGQVTRTQDGHEFPVINGREARPADGWDGDATDFMAYDDAGLQMESRAIGEEIASRTAADYPLKPFDEVGTKELPRAPKLGRALGGDDHAAIEKGWRDFQKQFGIENGSGTWLLEYGNEGVRINRQTYDFALAGEDGSLDQEIAKLFPLIAPTLASPIETWWVPHQLVDDAGTTFVKRYIGLYSSGKSKRLGIVLDRTAGGWLWRVVGDTDLERYRAGLLVNTKAARAATGGLGGAKVATWRHENAATGLLKGSLTL